MTLVCAGMNMTGTPFGTVIAWLSTRSNGWPSDVTRVAAVVNCAVRHGCGPPGVANGQPAIVYWLVIATAGCPPSKTCELATVGVAIPMCAQFAVVKKVTSGPGIVFRLRQTMVRAPLLIEMVGPIIVIDPPLPLSM